MFWTEVVESTQTHAVHRVRYLSSQGIMHDAFAIF